MSRLALVLTLAFGSNAMAAAADGSSGKNAIAVLDIQGTGVAPELLPTLTEILTVEISELGLYKVVAGRDIQAMLGFEQQKDVLGCSDAACLAEIGGALGVERIVAGHIGMIGSTYVVNIKLINIRMADTEARVYETVRGEVDALITTVKTSVRKLLGPGSQAAAAIAGVGAPARPASVAATSAPAPVVKAPTAPPAAAPTTRSEPTKTAALEQPPAVSTSSGRHLAIGVAPVVFWSVGALALGTGALAGIRAKAEERTANDTTAAGGQVAADAAPGLATAANVLLGAGVLAVASGFAWSYFVTGAPAAEAAPVATLAPVIRRDGIGLAAVGSF